MSCTPIIAVNVWQWIHANDMASIESWILTPLFNSKIKHNCFKFSLGCYLECVERDAIFSDEELTKALSESRKVCREFCTAVEQEINKWKGRIPLATVNYEKIFQSILQRSPDGAQHHISCGEMLRWDCSSYDETLTLITPYEIHSLYTKAIGYKKVIKRKTQDLASPYFWKHTAPPDSIARKPGIYRVSQSTFNEKTNSWKKRWMTPYEL